MKKRLLALLLTMAMILSMVPVQALAEEIEDTPAMQESIEEVLPETIEEVIPEATEEIIPETTEEIIPETTEEIIPETTEEIVPETTEEIVPEITEETVPEITEETVPEYEIDGAFQAFTDGSASEDFQLITDESIELRAGQSCQLQARLGEDLVNAGITYAFADEEGEKYATLENAELTIKDIEEEGSFDIAVSYGEEGSATIHVDVYPALKIAIAMDGEPITDPVTFNMAGEKNYFVLSVQPSDEGPYEGADLKITKSATLVTAEETEGGLKVTPKKTGTITVSATAKGDPACAAVTIKLITAPVSFKINPLPSFKDIGVNTMRAGTRVALTTDIDRKMTDKTLVWEVRATNENESDELDSYVTIDSKKGVLSVDKNLPEPLSITVKASLASGLGTPAELEIIAQPPVNSFNVCVPEKQSQAFSAPEYSTTAVNRTEKVTDLCSVNDGNFTLRAEDFSPAGKYYVIWKISKNNAFSYAPNPDNPNEITVTPKAPGKLAFTATSADGSGAKYTGAIIITAQVEKTAIETPKTTTLIAGQSLTLKAKAWYDENGVNPAASPKVTWTVKEVVGDAYIETTLASISNRGALKTDKALTKTTKLAVFATVDGVESEPVIITVKPVNTKTLVLATFTGNLSGSTPLTELTKEQLVAIYNRAETPSVNIVPALKSNNGALSLAEEADEVGVTIKASDRKIVPDYTNCTLTFAEKDNVKYTITATYGKQRVNAVFTVDTFADTVVIKNGATASVDPGKTLKLNAESVCTDGETTRLATFQKFTWKLSDNAPKGIKLSNTGILTAPKLDRAETVTVTVTDYYGNTADIVVTINPIKQTKITAALADDVLTNGVFVLKGQATPHIAKDSFRLKVLVNGEAQDTTVTNVTTKSKTVEIVTTGEGESAAFAGINFTGTGKVTLTVTGTYTDGSETKTVSANLAFNVVKAVTDITVYAPTAKLYVGKTAKFTADVNKDATNKKLIWHVGKDAEGTELDANDKTTIKDGMLKVDASWNNNGRDYYVWAEAADGYGAESQKEPITAYAQVGSVNVYGTPINGTPGTYLANNQEITISKYQSVKFVAEFLDADGKDTCYQGVKWTVSGNRENYVSEKTESTSDDFDDYVTLTLTGLEPGTVTVTATATDGSRKSASFTVTVPETLDPAFVTIIDGVGYTDLQAALDAAAESSTVKLLKDVDVTKTLVVDKTVTLDLNGKKLYNTTDIWDDTDGVDAWSLISVRGEGNLTVTGNGELDAKENDVYAIDLFDEGTKCTIENGKFTGNCHAVYVYEGSLTVNGGEFDVKQPYSAANPYGFVLNCYDASYKNGTASIVVNGGKFHQFNPANAVCEGAGTNFAAEGKCTIKEGEYYVIVDASDYTAIVGGVGYTDLQAALNAAAESSTVKLLKDVDVTKTLVVDKTVTLDLNGKKLYNTTDIWDDTDGVDAWSLISVRGEGNLTVTGNGELDAKENDVYAIDLFDEGTKCTIENGKFTGNCHAVYVYEGSLTVNGGEFDVKQPYSAANPYGFVLNCYDASYKNGTASIVVNGGKFHQFNPANAVCEGAGTNFAAEGKCASKEGEYYVIVDESDFAAIVGGVGYTDLQTALDAAPEGSTVKLLKDIKEEVVVPAGKEVTLNLNRHDIEGDGTTIKNNGTLTIDGNGRVFSDKNVAVGVGHDSVTTIKSGTYVGQEGAVITGYATGATINILDGTFTAIDNAVIAGNGNATDADDPAKPARVNPNTINISGGTFNGEIKTAGYVACGIYAPWKDTINVTGGIFNSYGGAGIVARAGKVTVSGDATFYAKGNAEGWVGDSKTKVPSAALVFEVRNPYPALTDDSRITVNGGVFSSEVNAIAVVKAEGDTSERIVVNGGGFTSDPTDYCADGYGAVKMGDWYEVIEGNFAKDAATLKEMVANGGNVYLAKDITLTETLEINNAVTLVGEGHSIAGTFAAANANLIKLLTTGTALDGEVVLSNLKLKVLGNGARAIGIGSSSQVTALNLTIKDCDIQATQRGITVNPNNNSGINLNIDNTTISLVKADGSAYDYDTEYVNSTTRGISLWEMGASNVNIRNSTIQGFSYALNNSGSTVKKDTLTVNVEGSTLKGRAGINDWTSGTTWNVTSSKIRGINNQTGPSESFGCVVFNAGATNNNCNVNGSTFTTWFNEAGGENARAKEFMFVIRADGNTIMVDKDVTASSYTILDGDKGGICENVLANNDNTSTVALYGGTYSTDPTGYLADGCAATVNADGTWTVSAASAE